MTNTPQTGLASLLAAGMRATVTHPRPPAAEYAEYVPVAEVAARMGCTVVEIRDMAAKRLLRSRSFGDELEVEPAIISRHRSRSRGT